MFLSDLSMDERKAFLSLARNMVAADEKVTPEEEQMLRDLHSEAGYGLQIEPHNGDIEALCGLISNTVARAKVMLELASVAYVDGDYEVRERALLNRIAKAWGIEQLSFLRSEDWGKKRVELAIDAAHIIHEISNQ